MLTKTILARHHHENLNGQDTCLGEQVSRTTSTVGAQSQLTNAKKIVQSSQPRPDLLAIRLHSRVTTRMGVKTKKIIQGTRTCAALLSPGLLPGNMIEMIINTRRMER